MPSTPYAALRVSVNGGGATSGGITCTFSDVIQLSAVSYVGWGANSASPTARWEIFAYPVAFSLPAGWSQDSTSGAYYYLGNGAPPSFTLPASTAAWGKWLFRLTVDGGVKNGVVDSTLIDEASGVQIPDSTFGFRDIAYREGSQFSATKAWISDLQADLRTMTAVVAGSTTPIINAVRGVVTANVSNLASFTVAQTGITYAGGDYVLLIGQSTGSQNGAYLVGAVTTGHAALTRATWANSAGQIPPGTVLEVGPDDPTYPNSSWVLITPAPITLGTTALVFIEQQAIVDPHHFGAKGDGVTNDYAAINAAITSLPATGGAISFRDGNYVIGTTLTITKPVVFILGRTTITGSGGGATTLIATTANLTLVGSHSEASSMVAIAGGTHVQANKPWSTPVAGQECLRLYGVRFANGRRGLDTQQSSGPSPLNEAFLDIRNCLFDSQTDYAVFLESSTYYGSIAFNQVVNCKGGFRIKDNTETKLRDNIVNLADAVKFAGIASISSSSNQKTLTMAGLSADNVGDTITVLGAGASGRDLYATILTVSGSTVGLDTACQTTVSSVDAYVAGFPYLLEGVDHVELLEGEVHSYGTSSNADIRVWSAADANGGIFSCSNVKFGAERDLWLRPRPVIEFYNPTNPQYAVWGAKITNNRIYAPVFLLLDTVARASNVATATVFCNHIRGHGLQVGDKFYAEQFTDSTFAAGINTVTAIGAIQNSRPTTTSSVSASTSVPVTSAAGLRAGDSVIVQGNAAKTISSISSNTLTLASAVTCINGASVVPASGFVARQDISWANTGSNVSATSIAGVINSADAAAIKLVCPLSSCLFTGNTIDGWAYSIDDTAPATDQARGRHGLSRYYGNFELGPVGLFTGVMKSGWGRGFIQVEACPQALINERINSNPRSVEQAKIQNLVTYSNDRTNWSSIGVTVSGTPQADDIGGTTATLLTRTGANAVYGGVAGPGGTLQELVNIPIDVSAIGAGGYIKFRAKAGTLNAIWCAISDGTTGFIMPGSNRITPLDSTFRPIKIPFTVNPGHGALGLAICPGGQDACVGTITVMDFQICEFDSDFVPTTGTKINDTAYGAAFRRGVKVDTLDGNVTGAMAVGAGSATASLALGRSAITATINGTVNLPQRTATRVLAVDSSKNIVDFAYTSAATASNFCQRDASAGLAVHALTVSNIVSSGGTVPSLTATTPIGTGGTYTLEAGSDNMAGVILINSGTTSPSAGLIRVTGLGPFAGNSPMVMVCCMDGANGIWGNTSSCRVKGAIPGTYNSTFDIGFINATNFAGTNFTDSISDVARIAYWIVQK